MNNFLMNDFGFIGIQFLILSDVPSFDLFLLH